MQSRYTVRGYEVRTSLLFCVFGLCMTSSRLVLDNIAMAKVSDHRGVTVEQLDGSYLEFVSPPPVFEKRVACRAGRG